MVASLLDRVVGDREALTRKAASEATATSMTFRVMKFISIKPDIDFSSSSIIYVMVANTF
jgi:hypothetical protein